MPKVLRAGLAAFALSLAVGACGTGGEDPPVVSMKDHSFTPQTLEISGGDTIKWINDTDEAHTVTAAEDSLPDGAAYFSSGNASDEREANEELARELIDPGGSFQWTFDEAGTYRYYCIPHKPDGMVGEVVVE